MSPPTFAPRPTDERRRRSPVYAGQGAACCRYLTASKFGICCEKLTALKALCDAKVEAGAFVARGDNCAGRRGPVLPGDPPGAV
jgi:hypothetical protein